MARRIGVTMRVVEAAGYVEPRDALAQDWATYMSRQFPGRAWMPLPNLGEGIVDLVSQWGLDGFILSGGNDLGSCSLRDETEYALLAHALRSGLPLFGVCRGLQVLQRYHGGELSSCGAAEHAGKRHEVEIVDWPGDCARPQEQRFEVNSFHTYGVESGKLAASLRPLATSSDGWVEGLTVPGTRVMGVMWHPERESALRALDSCLLDWVFGEAS